MNNSEEQILRQQLDDALKANNMNLAASRLNDLIRHFVQTRQIDVMVSTLEGIVKEYTEEWSFRWRLITLYERLGQNNAAIEHLNILSEQMMDIEDNDMAGMVVQKLIQLRGDTDPPEPS